MSSRLLLSTVLLAGFVIGFRGRCVVQANDGPYNLEDFSDLTSCKAKATTRLVITGGTGSVRASASCEAKREAVNSVVVTVGEWLNIARETPTEGCTKEKIMTVAKAVGLAIASAYTTATFELDIDGSGTACASAEAEADSYDVVFAKALLEEPVNRSLVSTTDDGLCFTGALSLVFAAAWSSAKKTGCIDSSGGFSETQTSFAESVEQAVARILGEIAIHVCITDEERKEVGNLLGSLRASDTVAKTSAETGTETVQRVVDGMGRASGGILVQCTDEGAAQCCAPSPSEDCDWKQQAGLLWEAEGGQHCCCVEGLLSYLH